MFYNATLYNLMIDVFAAVLIISIMYYHHQSLQLIKF